MQLSMFINLDKKLNILDISVLKKNLKKDNKLSILIFHQMKQDITKVNIS